MNSKIMTLDFAVISNSAKINSFLEVFCKEMEYDFEVWETDTQFFDAREDDHREIRFILVCSDAKKKQEEIAQMVQVAKQMCPKSFICSVIMGTKMSRDAAAFIIKSGADVFMLEHELLETYKLEYIAHHVIKGAYIPIKLSDLEENKELLFSVYHYAAGRNKFLICGHEGLVLTPEKFEKMKKYGEFYVKRDDIEKFTQYTESSAYAGSASMERRCRSQFLSLCKNYSELVFLLTDYGRSTSFQAGKDLLKKCETLTEQLIASLAAVEDLWQVINQRTLDEKLLDMVPAITAYAGLFALRVGQPNISEIMVALMLADLSLIFMNPVTCHKLTKRLYDDLSQEELAEYREHPNKSIQIALDRKVPMTNKIRDMILGGHETADGKGFPKGRSGEKITVECSIMHFAELYHKKSSLGSGEATRKLEEFNDEMLDDEDLTKFYKPTFLKNIKTMLFG